MKLIKSVLALFVVVFCSVSYVPVLHASDVASLEITLDAGWNIVSTPKVLESHVFSVAETADNFDIYMLDASRPSGWATMADLGQNEFTPLFGYFINNKTDSQQTLTFNFDTSLEPTEKLFDRTFTNEGWYSIGVADSEYAKSLGADRYDNNNPSQLLSLMSGRYDRVIDFTDEVFDSNRKSVALSNPWKSVVPEDIDSLNDLREGKGYAVYIKDSSARYNGLQSDATTTVNEIDPGVNFSLNSDNPDSYLIQVEMDTNSSYNNLLTYDIQAVGGDVRLDELVVNLSSDNNLSNVLDGVRVKVYGNSYNATGTVPETYLSDFTFPIANPSVMIYEGESATVEVFGKFKAQAGNYDNGATVQAEVTTTQAEQTIALGIDGQISPDKYSGQVTGDTHMLLTEGIIVPADGFASDTNTQGEDDTIGVFELTFEVSAFENDFYIAASGVNFTVTGGAATTNYIVSSSADEDTDGVFTVEEGNTETFTLTVTVDPTATAQFRVTLDSIDYTTNADGVTNTTRRTLAPASDFRTAYKLIQGS